MSAMDERPEGNETAARPPAVKCTDCAFAWHTARMAEGLRLLGSCPRCGGRLEFPDPTAAEDPGAEAAPPVEPHLVLGLPRPPRR